MYVSSCAWVKTTAATGLTLHLLVKLASYHCRDYKVVNFVVTCMYHVFQSPTGDNVEFIWQASVGKHKGFIPQQFLKENRYSNETVKRNGKESRSNKMMVAKMVGHVL